MAADIEDAAHFVGPLYEEGVVMFCQTDVSPVHSEIC